MIYSNKDGTASKESEEIYQNRIWRLCFLTSLVSLLGTGAFSLSGGYARENESWKQPIFLAKLLWVSTWDKSSLITLGLAANSIFKPLLLLHSLVFHWIESPVKLYASALRGVLSAVIIVSLTLEKAQHDEESFFDLSSSSLPLVAALILAILQIQFPRPPDVFSPEGRPVDF
jgi:hypothetical protein